MLRSGIILLTATVLSTSTLLAEIVPVKTSADWDACVAAAAREPTICHVTNGAIYMGGKTVVFPRSEHPLKLIGEGPDSTIQFDWHWDGDWSTWRENITNGITLYGNHNEIIGIRFTSYEGHGSAVKVNNPDAVTLLHDCRFESISTTRWTPDPEDKRPVPDTWFANCIGGGGRLISVTACEFRNCCTSNRMAHCVYVWAEANVIAGCTFDGCGSDIKCYYGSKPIRSLTQTGNIHRRTRPSAEVRGEDQWQRIIFANPSVCLVNARNAYTGHSKYPVTGATVVGLRRHWIDWNDYSGLVYHRYPWASTVGYDWDQWVSVLGHDLHSAPPTKETP